MKKLVQLLIILLLIISCSKRSNKSERIIVQRLEYNGNKTNINLYLLQQNDSSNYKIYHYSDTSKLNKNVDLVIDTSRHDFVIFCSDTFRFVDNKSFLINNKAYLVDKYIGGFKGVDSGLILYLNSNLGILMIQSFGWGDKDLFIGDSIEENLANKLRGDTSGFTIRSKIVEKFIKMPDK